MTIRALDWSGDRQRLRTCLIALQDTERAFDPRMPSGESIADDYLEALKADCQQFNGRVLVAEENQVVLGYVCIHTRYSTGGVDEGPQEYGYISDLVVLDPWQGKGYGSALLLAAEHYAKECLVKWLRIGVLASNAGALDLYRRQGFCDYEIQLEKALD